MNTKEKSVEELGIDTVRILSADAVQKSPQLLKRSLELYRALERSGEERVDGQIISWGLTNRTKVLVRSGQLAGVDDLMKRVDAVLVDGITRTVRDGVAITANILMSLVIDHFGMFGVQQHSLSPGRMAGGALMVVGIALISKF